MTPFNYPLAKLCDFADVKHPILALLLLLEL